MLVCGSPFGSGWHKFESEASCELSRIGPVWDYATRAATVHAFSKHTPANATLSPLCVYRAAYSSSVTKPCITWKSLLINQKWNTFVHSIAWNQLRNWRKKCPAARLHVVFVFTHVFLESLCKNTLVPDCLSPVKLFYWHHRTCRPTAKPQ